MTTTLLVVITIDVESPQTPLFTGRISTSLFDPVVNGQRWGYSRILRILSRFGLKGVFFVNCYESALWGKPVMQEMCREIAEEGHEIGLHIHPACSYDPSRLHLWQYSGEEQVQIVTDGLKMFAQWLPGYKIAAHRAGAYGINRNSFHALSVNGILVDSSMFYGHENCKVHWSQNRVFEKDGLLEIPVTGFFREKIFRFGRTVVGKSRKFIKTDINCCSFDELVSFAEQARTYEFAVMNLFLHSYSFLRFNRQYSHMEMDSTVLERFDRFLAYITEDPRISVVTTKQIHDFYNDDPTFPKKMTDYAPVCLKEVSFLDRVNGKLRELATKMVT